MNKTDRAHRIKPTGIRNHRRQVRQKIPRFKGATLASDIIRPQSTENKAKDARTLWHGEAAGRTGNFGACLAYANSVHLVHEFEQVCALEQPGAASPAQRIRRRRQAECNLLENLFLARQKQK